MKRLRTAVVGVGYLGRIHAEKHRALPTVELVAVCDLRPDIARGVAEALGVRFVPDYRDLARDVDAVTIAASTSAHFELAEFFLERGVHVFVEKPMTQTAREAKALTELAEARGLKLQVGHVERFNPALLSVREHLRNVQFIECHRLAPFKPRGADVNVVLDLMIHDLDVVLSLVEARPTSVSAVGIKVLTDTFDIANARVEFDSGAIANLTASRVSTAAQRKFRVFEQNQYVSIDFGEGEVQRVVSDGALRHGQHPLSVERFRLDKGDALRAETEAFVEAVLDGTPCRVSGRDGLAALELAEAIVADIERRAIRGPRDRAP
jgi:predicted dehydrogenase